MHYFYHVTTYDNWKKIKKCGYLKPTIGKNAKACGENIPRIYLFSNHDALDNANWLDEIVPDTSSCVYLTIKLSPHDNNLTYNSDFFESYYSGRIPVNKVVHVYVEPPIAYV